MGHLAADVHHVHARRDARCELDQLVMDSLALALAGHSRLALATGTAWDFLYPVRRSSDPRGLYSQPIAPAVPRALSQRHRAGLLPAVRVGAGGGRHHLRPRPCQKGSRCGRPGGVCDSVAAGAVEYFYDPAYAKSPDWRGLAQAIDAERQTGDVILQNFPETSLVYYDRSRLPLVVYPTSFFPDQQTPQVLAALNSKYQRVWFIPAAQDFWDPNHFVEDWLDRHDDLLVETRVGTFRLELL